MTTNNNLDALFADAELPFGHPGRRSDDAPEGFEPSPLVDQGPEPDYTLDEGGRVVHYGPGDHPLCGSESMTAVYTDDPALVAGCRDCLELAAEDPGDDNEYMGHCLHCREGITAQGGVAPDRPEALPVLWEARMVTTSKDADARRTQRLTTAVFAVCYPTEVNVGAEDDTPPFPPATC